MTNLLVQGPELEPVSVQQLRDYLRASADDDALLTSLLTAARIMIEAQTGLRLISQDWQVYVNRWTDGVIELPIWPVQKITAVKFLPEKARTIDAGSYELVKVGRPALIDIKNAALPSALSARLGVQIDLRAGYGDGPEDVPETLSFAVLALAAHWYDIDDWNQYGLDQSIPPVVKTILDEYRMARI